MSLRILAAGCMEIRIQSFGCYFLFLLLSLLMLMFQQITIFSTLSNNNHTFRYKKHRTTAVLWFQITSRPSKKQLFMSCVLCIHSRWENTIKSSHLFYCTCKADEDDGKLGTCEIKYLEPSSPSTFEFPCFIQASVRTVSVSNDPLEHANPHKFAFCISFLLPG